MLVANASALPPELPAARANNPVARAVAGGDVVWFTGLGIAQGKTWRDLRANGWIYRDDDEPGWRSVPALPAFEGRAERLGSHAVVIGGRIHVIGGYTVAEDHSERSTPGIYRLSAVGDPEWTHATHMPVPVDDAVALVHEDRFLYLVSGWSDTGNVNLVQVWDSRDNSWRQAEPWPGAPVFGHAGGMVEDQMVVCGGARIEYPEEGPRKFLESHDCWLGTIRPDDRYRLDWKSLPPMPGGPRYRAAAAGASLDGTGRVIFAGGADRPYNYNGQGYDGEPAQAFQSVVSHNLDAGRWECHAPMPKASMDHRGLIIAGESLVVIGGMNGEREVVAETRSFALSSPVACRR
jgi:N-acetylneuraminic acid mutarotase